MKFKVAVLSLLVASAQAFSPKAFVPKSALNNNNNGSPNSELWRPPMNTNMVAGGAERAYGDEYYDGKAAATSRLKLYLISALDSEKVAQLYLFCLYRYISTHFFHHPCVFSIIRQVSVSGLPQIFHLFCFTTVLSTLECLWSLLLQSW